MKTLRILIYVGIMTLVGCGPQKVEVEDSNHVAGGKVEFYINWNLEAFDAIFRDGCELLEETPELIEECIQDKITNLLTLLEGMDETEDSE
jgi:hypothetical protein